MSLAPKTLFSVASRLARATRNAPFTTGAVGSRLLMRNVQTERNFTRSMWSMMCNRPTTGLDAAVTTAPTRLTKPCGCCGLHTKGDQDLSDFLTEEIKHEKGIEKNEGKTPTLKGFSLSTDGTQITCVKEADGEKVVIKFNVNNSVEDENAASFEEQTTEEAAAEMVSKPPFTVEINKGGDKTLAINCIFPPSEGYQPPAEGAEEYDDAIEIAEVALLQGEWDEKVYAVQGSIMDGNLYDMLLNMLEERGIDGTLVEEVVELSTSYEHKQYINFLENLQSFVNK